MRKWEKDGLEFKIWTADLDNKAQNVTKDLLKNLMYEMATLSLKFDNPRYKLYNPPYTYTERRLDGILLPALSKICNGYVMTEMPVTRQYTNEEHQKVESSGRADYWCIYKNYSFVIELKQGYDCYTTPDSTTGKLKRTWNTMNKQLKIVESTCKSLLEKTEGVIRLGITVITSYSDKEPDDEQILIFRNNINKIHDHLYRDLGDYRSKTKPDMSICWIIPTDIVYGYDQQALQTFPGLWIMAKTYEPINHKGARMYKKKE